MIDYKKILKYTSDLNVLYAEDDEIIAEETIEILEDLFENVESAQNGQIALDKYKEYYDKNGKYYDLVLTDINMPIMDGEKLIKHIKDIHSEQKIIVISAYNESSRLVRLIQAGISNFAIKPIEAEQFFDIIYNVSKDVYAHKKLLQTNENLSHRVDDLYKEIRATQRLSVETIGNLIESYDDDTGRHVQRIENYSRVIANELLKDEKYKNFKEELEITPFASLLHDVGKLTVPEKILKKPAKLTKEEFEEIKQHSQRGGEILLKANGGFKKEFNKDSFFKVAADIAYYHHEKYNGKGYPKGLDGENIPLSARIVAIADVYDALRSKRCYKDGFTHEKSVNIIKDERGTTFDPAIVDIFLNNDEKFNEIFETLNDEKYYIEDNSTINNYL